MIGVDRGLDCEVIMYDLVGGSILSGKSPAEALFSSALIVNLSFYSAFSGDLDVGVEPWKR